MTLYAVPPALTISSQVVANEQTTHEDATVPPFQPCPLTDHQLYDVILLLTNNYSRGVLESMLSTRSFLSNFMFLSNPIDKLGAFMDAADELKEQLYARAFHKKAMRSSNKPNPDLLLLGFYNAKNLGLIEFEPDPREDLENKLNALLKEVPKIEPFLSDHYRTIIRAAIQLHTIFQHESEIAQLIRELTQLEQVYKNKKSERDAIEKAVSERDQAEGACRHLRDAFAFYSQHVPQYDNTREALQSMAGRLSKPKAGQTQEAFLSGIKNDCVKITGFSANSNLLFKPKAKVAHNREPKQQPGVTFHA